MTVVLTAPFALFVYSLAIYGMVGLVIYGGFVYPRAMRDVWRRSDRG